MVELVVVERPGRGDVAGLSGRLKEALLPGAGMAATVLAESRVKKTAFDSSTSSISVSKMFSETSTASYSLNPPPRWVPGMTPMEPFSGNAGSIASQTVSAPDGAGYRVSYYPQRGSRNHGIFGIPMEVVIVVVVGGLGFSAILAWYLTQPIQIVAGSVAGSRWMSDDLFERAASTDKAFHVVDGASHMDLYDGRKFVEEAVSVLAPFFTAKLAANAAVLRAAE